MFQINLEDVWNYKHKDKVEDKGILVITDTRLHHRKSVLTKFVITECETEINKHISKPLFFTGIHWWIKSCLIYSLNVLLPCFYHVYFFFSLLYLMQ